VLLLVPVLEIFFDLRPVSLNVGIDQWFLAYAGFYGLQIVLAFFTLGSFRIEVLMLAASSFPIYIKAFMNVIIGRDTAWSVTGASKRAASPFNFLTLQVVTFVILVATTAVGIWRDVLGSQISVATVWAGLNMVILGAFLMVAMAEARRLRRDDKGVRAIDAKSVALGEFLAAPEPRSTPYTLVLAELRARQTDADRHEPMPVPAIKETAS